LTEDEAIYIAVEAIEGGEAYVRTTDGDCGVAGIYIKLKLSADRRPQNCFNWKE
jgi:hypothetical protein